MGTGAVLLVVASGVLAGAVHVFAGVDHLAALLPLSLARGPRAWRLGARWGVGHSLGVLAIGGLGVFFKERLDLALVETWGERLVGVLLVAIGALGIRRALRLTLHTHAHAHDGASHEHLHLHATPAAHEPKTHTATATHGHTAFVAGSLHGIAGTAHLLGVLPALALPGALASGAYLLAFAVGTVLGMAAFAWLVGAGGARLAPGPALLRPALCTAGIVTVAVGVAWIAWPLLDAAGRPS
jgi:hypothetical protein